jgi:hypothetical protein
VRQSNPSTFFLLFLVAAAVFGSVLIPFLLFHPNFHADQLVLRRPLIATLFSVVCILGVVAVFYPSKCRMMFKKPKGPLGTTNTSASAVQFKGHHPDCPKFSVNRVTVGGRVFCAACSGLLVGAIAALVAIVMFALGLFDAASGSLWVLLVGEALMLLGLAQINMGGYVKLAVNALFVVGSCISLVVIDLVAQNLLLDGYLLGLIVFMLWLRIQLSEWKNKKTCLACGRCF